MPTSNANEIRTFFMWDFQQYLKNHSTDANFKHFSVSKNWAYDTYTARSVNMGMPLTFSYNLNVFVLQRCKRTTGKPLALCCMSLPFHVMSHLIKSRYYDKSIKLWCWYRSTIRRCIKIYTCTQAIYSSWAPVYTFFFLCLGYETLIQQGKHCTSYCESGLLNPSGNRNTKA